jgi:hypothetical protein
MDTLARARALKPTSPSTPVRRPSSLQKIRLSSDGANQLNGSRNWWADGDGCDGLHLDAGVVQRLKGLTVCTVGSEHWRGSLSGRTLIAENRCAALFVSTVAPARSLCAGCRPPPLHGQGPPCSVGAGCRLSMPPFHPRQLSHARTFIAAEHSSQLRCAHGVCSTVKP